MCSRTVTLGLGASTLLPRKVRPNAPLRTNSDHSERLCPDTDPAGGTCYRISPRLPTVASGLDNPRLLSWSGGALYVAEAGRGGDGPCVSGPEGQVCLGSSGAITRVTRWSQRRVLSQLPSLAAPDGTQAIGPTDVIRGPRHLFATIGLGLDPALRAQFAEPGALLGTVISTPTRRRGPISVFTDLAAAEAASDPDGAGPDSNPTGLLAVRRHWRKPLGPRFLVTDSGANALLAIAGGGRSKPAAVFDSPGTAPAPFPPFQQIPMESVPTSVTRGPDGAWYVSELTGFPFQPGASRIHRVMPGMPSSVWATGLTNVTDLTWHRGHLYAVQLADAGLLGSEGLPTGSLVEVRNDAPPRTVADALPAPYGVAVRGRSAYVTTCSVCAGGGSVVKVPLN